MSRPMARSRRVNAAILAQIERMMYVDSDGVRCCVQRPVSSFKKYWSVFKWKKERLGGTGAPNTH